MPTLIRKELAITDNKGNVELILYGNVSDGITITQEDPMEGPYLCVTFTKDDWKQIKKFVDEQLGIN